MYKIHNKEFSTKTDIKQYTSGLLINNLGRTLVGDDDLFARELLRYHEHNYNIDKIVSISCRNISNNAMLAPVFQMVNKRGTVSQASLHTCINKMPDARNPITEYVFSFGKYKGKSVEEVNDIPYLKWLLNKEIIHSKRLRDYFEFYIRDNE
jgi:hypothetical protein